MLTLADVMNRLLEGPNPLFFVGGTIAVVSIVSCAVTKMVVGRSRERTRREIAAYVAEGTIDPDNAVKMLQAGPKSCE